MENNQEHKLDKIFRETFENQEITPPSDAWMGIYTYTIGQEEKKPKVWLKYASLAMLLLLISGFGFWYFVDNQRYTSKLLTQKVVSENTAHGGRSSVRTQTTAQDHGGRSSVRTQTTALKDAGRVKLSDQFANVSENSLNRKTNAQTQDLNFQEVVVQIPIIENYALIGEDNLTNKKNEFIEPMSYLTDNNLEKIEPKPLILNDLIDKILNENEGKIVALEENVVDKKEVFKVDSVDYGSKFSLRHPIISYGLGMLWNFWDFERQVPVNGLVELPNRNGYGAMLKLGLAWKINKRLRMGVNIGINVLDVGIPSISIPRPLTSSALGSLPIISLTNINSDKFYQAETPFGNVNIPINEFSNIPTVKQNLLDEQKQLFYSNSHKLSTAIFSINSQYDLISIKRKKGKHYGYQLYGLLDFNIQRQLKYNYSASILYLSLENGQYAQRYINVFHYDKHLQNASEFVFGLRTGLGFRYQFARKWDFYVEGSGQHSLNNWVKSDEIKTFQRALSLQAGINLNL